MNMETMEEIRKKLIDILGKEEFEKKIIKIADILNDLEYHDINLPIEDIVKIVTEILEDKAKKIHRMQWQVERAMEIKLRKSRRRGLGKFVNMSTAERIWLLEQIKTMREKQIPWKEIKKILKMDARSMIYNIIEGKMFATEVERRMAKEIWEKLIRHPKRASKLPKWNFETVKV